MGCVCASISDHVKLSSILHDLAMINDCRVENINLHFYMYKGDNYVSCYYKCRNLLKLKGNKIAVINPKESQYEDYKHLFLYFALDVKIDIDVEPTYFKY